MVRFLANADLNESIVTGCLRREPTMDFRPANEANLEGVPNPEVLALVTEQDRILVSHDFQTMPWRFGDFLQTRGSSPGVILALRYLPIGEAIEGRECAAVLDYDLRGAEAIIGYGEHGILR